MCYDHYDIDRAERRLRRRMAANRSACARVDVGAFDGLFDQRLG
ncbi:hypothetical protein OG871_01965 [Kitasatospora sp. NBC_00374]